MRITTEIRPIFSTLKTKILEILDRDLFSANLLCLIISLMVIFNYKYLDFFQGNLAFLLNQILLIILPYIYIELRGCKLRSNSGYNLSKGLVSGEAILYAVVLVIFIYPVVLFINLNVQGGLYFRYSPEKSTYFGGGDSLRLISLIVFYALIPAICEELFFRGFLYEKTKHKSLSFIYLINALSFTLIHLNPENIFGPMVLSVLTLYLRRAYQSIFPAIVGHFVYNSLAIITNYIMVNLDFQVLKYLIASDILIYKFILFLIVLSFIFTIKKLIKIVGFKSKLRAYLKGAECEQLNIFDYYDENIRDKDQGFFIGLIDFVPLVVLVLIYFQYKISS